MKGEAHKSKKVFAFSAAILLCLCFAIPELEAQNSKRKSKRTSRPAVAQNQVIIPQTEPEIISRAEDNLNDNQTITAPRQEAPVDNFETKIDQINTGVKDLRKRVKSLEATKTNEYDEKQKRLLLNLDILTRAETRSESLRKQLFDMIEKESSVKTRLSQIENDSRTEMIDRSVAFSGSLRPEELREMRRKNMESEKQNLQNLLTEIQSSRTSLETNVQKADALVEKLRFKLEKDIDDALTEQPK
jgi:septal ring factor EnvC (AmiA/AmiB activator)